MIINEQERPFCGINTLALDSMGPNKFKRHIEKVYEEIVGKAWIFLQIKLDSLDKQKIHFQNPYVQY